MNTLTPENENWFKQESLNKLAEQLITSPYPSYPQFENRLNHDNPEEARELLQQPGTHWTEVPFTQPKELHPWFDDMVTCKQIGVLAGKGAYWNVGVNPTADPIIVRYDKDEPLYRVITRADTDKIALAGGFVDRVKGGGYENPYITAIREAYEETQTNLLNFTYKSQKIYNGPLADPRVTAHAWPLTHAYIFNLDPMSTKGMPTKSEKGHDDAAWKHWKTLAELDQAEMHGSHRLLIELALRK